MREANIGDVWDRILKKEMAGERLAPLEREVTVVLHTDFELLSGGVLGYLRSSAADSIHETIRVLDAIGAPRTKELLERASSFFRQGKPNPDQDERAEQLADMTAGERDALDLMEYDEEGGELRAILLRYWNKKQEP